MKKGSPRRALFSKEFLVDLNATKAAQRCGYSKKTAYSQGQRLLKNVEIQKAIRALMEKREEKLEMTSEIWLRELIRIYLADIKDYMIIEEGGGTVMKTFEEMPEGASRVIEAIEEFRTIKESADGKESNIVHDRIKYKFHCKLEAGKMIGEHLGYLKGNRIDLPGLEKALYEISEKFLPAIGGKKKRSDEPK